MHDPHIHKEAYVQEVLAHLQDYSTPLWDQINAYDDLVSRAERPPVGGGSGAPYDDDILAYYQLSLRDSEARKATFHAFRAKLISKSDRGNESVRKLVQQLHSLDRSNLEDIVKLRNEIEKASNDISLNQDQLDSLQYLQEVFLHEHFRECFSFIPEKKKSLKAVTDKLYCENVISAEISSC